VRSLLDRIGLVQMIRDRILLTESLDMGIGYKAERSVGKGVFSCTIIDRLNTIVHRENRRVNVVIRESL